MSDGDALYEETLDWLLEPENPSVRYWALRDLLDRDADHSDVREAQDRVMGSPQVRAILAAQRPEGHWVNSDDMYNPKYKASTHSLLILAELGARKTPKIERGLEHMFEFQRDSGHFLTNLPKTSRGRASVVKDGCCLDANILYYMVHFGLLEDLRILRLLNFTVDYHSTDVGGWRCRAYPIDPSKVFPVNCYMGSVKVLRSLSTIPEEKRSKEINEMIDREVENVLENRVFRYLRNEDGSRKDKAGWKRFGFPLFYQSDALEVLDTLTRLGVRDGRMEDAIRKVEEARRPDGRWLLKNTFNGKMWSDIETKGKPSKWITLRALRALRRYRGEEGPRG